MKYVLLVFVPFSKLPIFKGLYLKGHSLERPGRRGREGGKKKVKARLLEAISSIPYGCSGRAERVTGLGTL